MHALTVTSMPTCAFPKGTQCPLSLSLERGAHCKARNALCACLNGLVAHAQSSSLPFWNKHMMSHVPSPRALCLSQGHVDNGWYTSGKRTQGFGEPGKEQRTLFGLLSPH